MLDRRSFLALKNLLLAFRIGESAGSIRLFDVITVSAVRICLLVWLVLLVLSAGRRLMLYALRPFASLISLRLVAFGFYRSLEGSVLFTG